MAVAFSVCEFGAAAPPPLALSRLSPVGLTDDVAPPVWTIASSDLVRRYPPADFAERSRRIERMREGLLRSGRTAATDAAVKSLHDAERELRLASARQLVAEALAQRAGAQPQVDPLVRAKALETIAALRHPVELRDTTAILMGAGGGGDLVSGDPDVCRALFEALATDSIFGHKALVEFAVQGHDRIATRASQLLPERLPPNAVNELKRFLASSRERFINRAALIASAHPTGALIPALIQAQFEEVSSERKGDEAWIAIGKTTAYVAGLVPVTGDGSGAFAPLPGVIYEGSVLRIMESVVVVYRTEVHGALISAVEHATGQPAPPLGYDPERWASWYRDEYPVLAREFESKSRETELASRVKSSLPRDDG